MLHIRLVALNEQCFKYFLTGLDSSSSDALFPSAPHPRLSCLWQRLLPRHPPHPHHYHSHPPCFCSHSSSVSFSPSLPHGTTSVWRVLHMPCWKRFRQTVWMGWMVEGSGGLGAASPPRVWCHFACQLTQDVPGLISPSPIKLWTESPTLCSSSITCSRSAEASYLYRLSLSMNNMKKIIRGLFRSSFF